MSDQITTPACPSWCDSPYPRHLDWDDLTNQPGMQERTHTYGEIGSAASVCMDQVLDPATGVITDGAPYIFVSVDEFEHVDGGRARAIAADLVAAADRLDEIVAGQR
jgi:hypothetical protein